MNLDGCHVKILLPYLVNGGCAAAPCPPYSGLEVHFAGDLLSYYGLFLVRYIVPARDVTHSEQKTRNVFVVVG